MKLTKIAQKYLRLSRAYIKRQKRAVRFVLFRSRFARQVKRTSKMEAKRALVLTFKYLQIQWNVRPRIRLITFATLALVLALFASNYASGLLDDKKEEIKVNGKAVLVADKTALSAYQEEDLISASVVAKRSPFDFKYPVEGSLSQGYHSWHRALDIATNIGAPIRPLGAGFVEFAGHTGDGKGNVVIVDHGDGIRSLYAHMGRINVSVGTRVENGSVLGTVGLTGRTTGPHVHLEIYDAGTIVNPADILPAN